MKTLMIALLCAAALLAAGSAHAYAIYNHVDHKVCVQNFWSQWYKDCKYTIPAHGTHNGKQGAGLSHVHVFWSVDGSSQCRCNKKGIDIPKGGYARIYSYQIQAYKHDGQMVDYKDISIDCNCPGPVPPAKKP